MAKLTASPFIIDEIKKTETLLRTATVDDSAATPNKIEYSIGYGHQILDTEQHLMSILCDDTLATELMAHDISKKIEPYVDRFVEKMGGCTQNQYDALVDMCYNCGPGCLERDAVFGMILRSSDEEAIKDLWKMTRVTGMVNGKRQVLKGLQKRREKEANLFYTP